MNTLTSPQFSDPRIPARLWAKVTVTPGGCWRWTGSDNGNGYPQCWLHGHRLAHRVFYEVLAGDIPAGLDLDHTCHTDDACAGGPKCLHRRCVNPAHLRPATRAENLAPGRTVRAGVAPATCPHGHPYTESNSYYDSYGRRYCGTCRGVRNPNPALQAKYRDLYRQRIALRTITSGKAA